MKKEMVSKVSRSVGVILLAACTFYACTREEIDPDGCNCDFYPEINQYLPRHLTADDVIGEDTYYSGKELRDLNAKCLETCP